MAATILIFSDGLPEDQKQRLAAHYTLADFSDYSDPTQAPGFNEALEQTVAAIGAGMPWPAELIARAPQLQVVSSISVGVDNYDIAALNRGGIALGHTPHVLTETTADLAMTLLMATARRIVELAEWVKADRWDHSIGAEHFGVNIHGKRLGLVGMGRIGQAIARRAALGFDMDVAYYNRSRKPEAENKLGLTYKPFDALLADSDFICAVVPATADTQGLFDAKAFERMPRHGIFINIARGAIVNEDDLVAALDNGDIRAAGLDVFQNEPVAANHPLVGRDDVIPLPHIGSATSQTRHDMARMAVDNVLAALDGQRMPACYNAAALNPTS